MVLELDSFHFPFLYFFIVKFLVHLVSWAKSKILSCFFSNSMYPGLSEKTSTETIITGVAPAKMYAYLHDTWY